MYFVIEGWTDEAGFRVGRAGIKRHLFKLARFVLADPEGDKLVTKGLNATSYGDTSLLRPCITAKEFTLLIGGGSTAWQWLSRGLIPSVKTEHHRWIETRTAILIYYSVKELQGPFVTAREMGVTIGVLKRYLDKNPEIHRCSHPFGLGCQSNYYMWKEVIADELTATSEVKSLRGTR